MSILRNEIPRSLDVNLMLECLSNPNLGSLNNPLTQRSIKSATNRSLNKQQQTTLTLLSMFGGSFTDLSKTNSVFNTPRPPALFNTQTNDGTSCVYYPNGQLAVLKANVFGFSIETNPSNSGTVINLSNNPNVSLSAPYGAASGGYGPCLTWQNFKNSFTTIVYDLKKTPSRILVKSASVHSNNAPTPISELILLDDTNNNRAMSKEGVGLIKPKHISYHAHHQLGGKKMNEGKILAIISANGYCVCYRANGAPRFICNETGGCLCDKMGAMYQQWKWDDIRFNDYEKIKSELSIDLNEYIRLEYRSPANIKLRYSCDKEETFFDLSCVKENQPRLKDLLNRTVSELPMKSKLGQVKLSLNLKPATIVTYKQQHTQQNQQSQNSEKTRKPSVLVNQNAKEFSDSRIDRLLDNTISFKDVPVMKDLLQIQKRIRTIFEDWLMYCRTSLGIMNPDLYLFPELTERHKTNRFNEEHSDFNKIVLFRRKSKSVQDFYKNSMLSLDSDFSKGFEYETQKSRNVNDLETNEKLHVKFYERSKSAFITRKSTQLSRPQLELIERVKHFRRQLNKGSNGNYNSNSLNIFSKSKHFPQQTTNETKKKELAKVLNSFYLTSETINNKNNESLFKSVEIPALKLNEIDNFNYLKKTKLNAVTNEMKAKMQKTIETIVEKENKLSTARTLTNEDLTQLCPVFLHNRIAFDKHDFDCKCKKQLAPFINDLEYDTMLRLLPSEQLVVVAVIDSEGEPSDIYNIIAELYSAYNKSRIQPCKESFKDDTRFFYYDIKTAAENSDHTTPLLVYRHNVGPGMVLIYKHSNLVFCDHIFNGYGYSQQDFLKQLQNSAQDAKNGKFLPYNFRFSYPIGKHGKRTPWGGQIGGLTPRPTSQEDFIPMLKSFRSIEPSITKTKDKEKLHLPKINKYFTSSLEV